MSKAADSTAEVVLIFAKQSVHSFIMLSGQPYEQIESYCSGHLMACDQFTEHNSTSLKIELDIVLGW